MAIIEARGLARTYRSRQRVVEAVREGYAGHYRSAVMVEGIAVSIGLAAICLWLAGRVFVRENA